MGRRVAAAWALIGFSVQCIFSIVGGASIAQGMPRALAAWGICGLVGYAVGTLVERAVVNSFNNFVAKQQEAAREKQRSQTESMPSDENAA